MILRDTTRKSGYCHCEKEASDYLSLRPALIALSSTRLRYVFGSNQGTMSGVQHRIPILFMVTSVSMS